MALLSLLVSMSLLVPPSQICEMMEAVPGHAHQESASEQAAHAHAAHSHSHADHALASRLSWAPIVADECCGSSEQIPLLAAAKARLSPPDSASSALQHAVAALPAAPSIFFLAHCHGRAGPRDKILPSRLIPSSLLGRAPPRLPNEARTA